MNHNIIVLTIEIYISGVKNRAGFATEPHSKRGLGPLVGIPEDIRTRIY